MRAERSVLRSTELDDVVEVELSRISRALVDDVLDELAEEASRL